MMRRRLALAMLALFALGSCNCALSTRSAGGQVNLVNNAAGASRLYVGASSTGLVAEHRDWLREAFRSFADEAPGIVKLIGPDLAVKRAASGWALGGPVASGECAWVEEVGEEYRYRIARSNGSGATLAPPGDFWVVASAVGHTASPMGAVVLWRPAKRAAVRDPVQRRDELWIAAVDRATGAVLKTTEVALTLPMDRARGVLLGGPASAPLLLLIGLPGPDSPAVYRLLALRLPTLDIAWESTLDPFAPEVTRASAGPSEPGRASEPMPSPSPTSSSDLRALYELRGAPLGDGSGWLFAHGHDIGRNLVIDHTFLIAGSGQVSALPRLHLTGTDQIGPILDQPAAFLVGRAGTRHVSSFVSLDAVRPRDQRAETLIDLATKIAGRAIKDAPELIPLSAAVHGTEIWIAPPVGGPGLGANSADVRGLLTTPASWHQSERPRVQARQQWLEDRARP